MTICRKCGTSNQDGKKFCVFCNELLIADPEEMAKREAAEKKRLEKLRKKLDAKHKRWKKALFMLIPIGVLDLLDLLLCLDLAFVGVGAHLGGQLGNMATDYLGTIVRLFGNAVYTEELVSYAIRGIELLVALGLIIAATVLTIIMIVRMVKWRKYRVKGDKKEQAVEQAMRQLRRGEQEEDPNVPVQDADAEAVKASVGELRVSYAGMAQWTEQSEAYEMPAPESETNFKALFDALAPQLWAYDEDSVRRILSAMSASRMMLCSAGALDRAGIFENLSGAFAVKAEQYLYPEQEAAIPAVMRTLLQQDEQSGTLQHTALVKALYTARYSPKNVCLAGVSGVHAAQTDEVFAPFVPYFRLPDSKVALFVGEPDAASNKLVVDVEEGKLVLSRNVWMLSILPESDRVPVQDSELGQYAVMLYLRNSGKSFPPKDAEEVKPLAPSVDAWDRAVASAEGEYYLPEELWRVIDQIEQQVHEMGGVGLSNRTLRMLERYTSVYMAMGGKASDAFDNGFAAVVAPAYGKQLQRLVKRENGETLSALLERMVGRERLPMTFEVLSSMKLL